jgi:uncharacterized protein YjcR
MKDKVRLKIDHVVQLAGACNIATPQLVTLLAKQSVETLDAADESKMVTLTLTRKQAKEMQRAILIKAQDEEISVEEYRIINDAFRRAYDETLRRKCGEA